MLAVPTPTVEAPEAGARRIFARLETATFAYGMIENASREMLREGTFGFARAAMPFAGAGAVFKQEDG